MSGVKIKVMDNDQEIFITWCNRREAFFYGRIGHVTNGYTSIPYIAKRYKTIQGATTRLIGKITETDENDFIKNQIFKLSNYNLKKLRQLKIKSVIQGISIEDIVDLYGIVWVYDKKSHTSTSNKNKEVVKYIKKKIKTNQVKNYDHDRE